MGILLRLARQWIAGETANDGVKRVKEANSKGILGLLNLLGENIKTKEDIEATVAEYLNLLELIDKAQIKSHISVKPTQLGLNVNFDYCFDNYMKIANSCAVHANNYLWVDMEDSPYTQTTIDLYTKILSKYPYTGIAIQSYLRRSEQDLKRLLPLGAKIRIVKGAYNEPSSVAFKSKKETTSNYSKLLDYLFAESTSENFIAVATHDSALIEQAKKLASDNPKVNYEFEMLMGVRDNLKRELVHEGRQVREYVPYGPEWWPYSIRRIKEKKSNIFLLVRSLFMH